MTPRDIVYGVVCLAYDVVESLATPLAPPSGPATPAAAAAEASGLRRITNMDFLDQYDEATRLEAEMLFQTRRDRRPSEELLGERRPSDPIGEGARRDRVLCAYRH